MPPRYKGITVDSTDSLRILAVNAARSASQALSKWFKRAVRVECAAFKPMPLETITRITGCPDDPVVAIHMALGGDLAGDVLLLFPERAAMELCDLLLAVSPGTTIHLGEMEVSCLQETGNILASAFTNSLASWLEL